MKARTLNEIITENKTVNPLNYSQIILLNLGDTAATINDNIPLPPGGQYSFDVDAPIIIDEATNIRFSTDSGTEKKILCLTVYYTK